MKEKKLRQFTKDKMMKSEEDPYYSPLTDEDVDKNDESVYDEETKKKKMEIHNLKKNYFDSKYEYLRKKIEDKYIYILIKLR